MSFFYYLCFLSGCSSVSSPYPSTWLSRLLCLVRKCTVCYFRSLDDHFVGMIWILTQPSNHVVMQRRSKKHLFANLVKCLLLASESACPDAPAGKQKHVFQLQQPISYPTNSGSLQRNQVDIQDSMTKWSFAGSLIAEDSKPSVFHMNNAQKRSNNDTANIDI